MISDERLEELARDTDDSVKVAAIELLSRRRLSRVGDDATAVAIEVIADLWAKGYVAGAQAEARACASVYESREAWAKRAGELKEALGAAIGALEDDEERLRNRLRKILENK